MIFGFFLMLLGIGFLRSGYNAFSAGVASGRGDGGRYRYEKETNKIGFYFTITARSMVGLFLVAFGIWILLADYI